jgi:hypothetical protein
MGHDVALRAVLTHIADGRVDRIVCLGDVATSGPALQRALDADLIRRYMEIPVIVQAVDACRGALGRSGAELHSRVPAHP